MATIVYQYGVPSYWRAPEELMQQLYLGHQLGNDLVRIALDSDTARQELWSSYPEIAEWEQAVATVDEEITELLKRVAQERQQDRKNTTRKDTAALLKDARGRRRDLKAQRKGAIAQVYEQAKDALEQLELERRQKVKELYTAYCSATNPEAKGLYWATFNAVLRHHDAARTRVRADRAKGKASQLRFHRWDGTGSFTVQLQKQTGNPDRTPELLASGEGRWKNVFQLGPWDTDPDDWRKRPRSKRRGTAMITLGFGKMIKVPVFVDRVLPETADVPEVHLVRRVVGGTMRWSLSVVAKIPDPEPVLDGPKVAIHLGWRRLPDGAGIRAAVWATDAPIGPPPAGMTDERSPAKPGNQYRSMPYVRQHGTWGEVLLPDELWHLVGRAPSIRSRRDQNFNDMRARLVTWLEQHPDDVEPLELEMASVRAWRSPLRLAVMCRKWTQRRTRDHRDVKTPLPAEFAAQLLPELELWWRRDVHLYRYEAGERDNLAARRDDVWRQIGAWLGSVAGLIVVGDEDYRQLRRKPSKTATEAVMPTAAAETTARARAAFVAPGRLRDVITQGATRRGVTVIKAAAKHVSRQHAECGHVSDADPQYAQGTLVDCQGCGQPYDQDVNAARNLLKVQRPEPAQPQEDTAEPEPVPV